MLSTNLRPVNDTMRELNSASGRSILIEEQTSQMVDDFVEEEPLRHVQQSVSGQ